MCLKSPRGVVLGGFVVCFRWSLGGCYVGLFVFDTCYFPICKKCLLLSPSVLCAHECIVSTQRFTAKKKIFEQVSRFVLHMQFPV